MNAQSYSGRHSHQCSQENAMLSDSYKEILISKEIYFIRTVITPESPGGFHSEMPMQGVLAGGVVENSHFFFLLLCEFHLGLK